MSTARRLLTAVVLSAMALSTTAAAERRPRPTTLYLSTGQESGSCSPTELTTSPTGQSNCGSISPAGGETTWTSPATDEGYPFTTPAGSEVEGQVTIGPDFAGYQDFTVDITVELNGETVYEQQTEHRDGVFQDDIVIEFTFAVPGDADVLEIESGAVTVAINGVQIRGNFIDGSGGSYLKFAPVLA